MSTDQPDPNVVLSGRIATALTGARREITSESVDVRRATVETVARAMWDVTLQPIPWGEVNGPTQVLYRRLATAAIAALPPSPAEEAVKRVEALADEWESLSVKHYAHLADRLRAAMASPAPDCTCDRVDQPATYHFQGCPAVYPPLTSPAPEKRGVKHPVWGV